MTHKIARIRKGITAVHYRAENILFLFFMLQSVLLFACMGEKIPNILCEQTKLALAFHAQNAE